jgi:hypothetical protein
MMRPDDDFDAALRGLFDDAAPPAHDPVFSERVMRGLPRADHWRAGAVALAALVGAAVASVQAAPLVAEITALLQDVGALAAGAVSGQALAMGVASVAALGLALILSWREAGLR